MYTFPTKNLIFLHDSKSNLKFLVDSGAWPHSSSAPSTGPHLVGANGKLVPVWGRCRQIVSFAGHDCELDFFLAAVATPIIGMDFLAKFELSIIPAKQQVLHEASGCTLTKASTSSFVSPWSRDRHPRRHSPAPGTKTPRGISVAAAPQRRAPQAAPWRGPSHQHR